MKEKPAGSMLWKIPKKNALISAIAVFALCAFAFSNFIFVLEINNGSLSGAMYPLKEEDWDHPRLRKLGTDERLLRVASNGATEFEKIILIRKWAHDQWRGGGGPFYYPPWDAVEILNLARNHGNEAFCAQYAIVFLQACLSLGFPARYVDLPGHFVVEIWSNEFNKWVIMDPTSDLHFRRGDDVLDGIDLCDAYWNNHGLGIVKVASDRSRTPIAKEDLKPYRDYSILVKNDQLSDPVVVNVNGTDRKLVLEKDYRKYPYMGRDTVGFRSDIIAWNQEGQTEFDKSKKRSDNPEDFRYPMNQTLMSLATTNRKKGEARLEIRGVNSSSFVSFMGMKDDSGVWRETGPNMIVLLEPGINKISCRIKTRVGRLGKPAYIKIYYKPSWLKTFQSKKQIQS